MLVSCSPRYTKSEEHFTPAIRFKIFLYFALHTNGLTPLFTAETLYESLCGDPRRAHGNFHCIVSSACEEDESYPSGTARSAETGLSLGELRY